MSGEGCAIALGIAGKTLSESGFTIFTLCDERDDRYIRVFDGVKCSLGHQLEFLPCGQWRHLTGILHSQEIGQRVENSIVLGDVLLRALGIFLVPAYCRRGLAW